MNFVIQIFVYGNYNIGFGDVLCACHGKKIFLFGFQTFCFWLVRKCMNIFRALSNYEDDIFSTFFFNLQIEEKQIISWRPCYQVW